MIIYTMMMGTAATKNIGVLYVMMTNVENTAATLNSHRRVNKGRLQVITHMLLLTHWGRHKMVVIFQTTFSNAFCGRQKITMFVFHSNIDCSFSLFLYHPPCVQLVYIDWEPIQDTAHRGCVKDDQWCTQHPPEQVWVQYTWSAQATQIHSQW